MNRERRKELDRILAALDPLTGPLEEARDDLENCRSEEQDYYDAMPEAFQNGDRGQAASEAADQLQTAYDALDQAVSSLAEAIEAINTAKGEG
jgi:prefoldin subunit 5